MPEEDKKSSLEDNGSPPARVEVDLPELRGDEASTAIGVEVTSSFTDPATRRHFPILRFIYSLAGLFVGLVCMIGGVIFFVNGVVGSTSWTAKILDAESTISDAALGAVLFIDGLFIILVTRFFINVARR